MWSESTQHKSLTCIFSPTGASFLAHLEQALGAPMMEHVTNKLLNGFNQLFREFDGSLKSRTRLRGRRRQRTKPKASSKSRQGEAGNTAATSANTAHANDVHFEMDRGHNSEQAVRESTAAAAGNAVSAGETDAHGEVAKHTVEAAKNSVTCGN